MKNEKMRRVYLSSQRKLHDYPDCAGEARVDVYVNTNVIDFMEKHNAICGRCGWTMIREARARRAERGR